MPTTRNRYQEGSLDRVKRANGPDVWVYRWREGTPDGRRVQRKKTIGDLKRFTTESAARRAVESLRAEINGKQAVVGELTFEQLWADFVLKELRSKQADRADTTIALYTINANNRLLPKWGDYLLSEITTTAVEEWLGELTYADSTKSKFRNQMSALFNHAIRHKHWNQFNPITGPSKGSGVRQSAKRQKTPDILSLAEMQAIISHIHSEPIRLAVLIAAITGLRKSEIRGLKWGDVDFDGLWLRLKRGKIGRIESKMKTEASRKPVPIPQEVADALQAWRGNSPFRADPDWVFASQITGKQPMWFDIAQRRHIHPAALEAGIKKQIGWHTWRRSLASLLAAKREDVKVVQELLRHANSKITLELYQQGDEVAKRNAQSHVTGLFVVPAKAF